MTNPQFAVTDLPKRKRFNLPRLIKTSVATVAVVGAAVLLKSKLNGSVDGKLDMKVKTDKS